VTRAGHAGGPFKEQKAISCYRQLIFSTHNPNMVVNGDADTIIALKAGDPVVGDQPENPRIEISESLSGEIMRDCIVF
jgi:hypothetical protein